MRPFYFCLKLNGCVTTEKKMFLSMTDVVNLLSLWISFAAVQRCRTSV